MKHIRPKTILFVHYNADSSGSALKRIEQLVLAAKADNRVVLLLPKAGTVSSLLSKHGVNIEFRKFHDNTGLPAYFLNALNFAKFCIINRVDLIHILDHVWWKPAELIAAKILKIPFVSMITFNRPADAKAGAVRWAARIVANSSSTAQDFIDAGLGSKTCVVHNAVEPMEYQNAISVRSELFGNQNVPEDAFLFAYVGVIHPVKGIDVLLKSFSAVNKAYPDTRLVLVGGEKDNGCKSELLNLSSELGLESVIHWTGFRTDINSVMRSIDTLVVPSRQEPFGFVTIEAGAASRPVIASAVGGIPEIVRDGVDGLLVSPDNVDQLAAAMIKIVEQPQLRESFSENFYQRVCSKFSNERMLKQWSEIYDELFAN